MENGTTNLPRDQVADAPQDYAERLAKQVAVPLFEAALLRLGRAWSHGEVVALFNGRASYTAIQDWRSGRRRVPQWAWDYLGVLLDQTLADVTSVRASVRNPPSLAPGRGSHRNIAAWNARRAALIAEKKKAGS